MTKSFNLVTVLILIFALLGAVVSGYLWYHHNILVEQKSDALLIPCTIGDSFNCDVVNVSSYSMIFGIPIAAFGVLSYLIVGLFALFGGYLFSNRVKWTILMIATGLMSLYGAYLFYISKFWIGAYCIFCMITYLCSFIMFGSSWTGWKRS